MIILTTGATRIGSRLLRPADGPFEAEAEVEARLVKAGAARNCQSPAVATLQKNHDATGTGENTPAPETPQATAIGSLDPEQLSTMTNANLKKLAEDLGLDTAKLRVKADFVAAISAVEFPVEDDPDDDEDEDAVDDGDTPPDLGAEAPVV